MNDTTVSKRGKFRVLLQCFNVAAICALAVWHAYVLYINNVATDMGRTQYMELLPAEHDINNTSHKVII